MLVFYVLNFRKRGTTDVIDGKINIFLILIEIGGRESQSF